MRSAYGLERLEQRIVRRADAGEQVPALGALHIGEREKEMLGRHEFVAKFLRVRLGLVEYLVQLARECRLRVRLLWIPRHLASDRFPELRDADAQLLEDGNDDALVLRQERQEEVQIVDERVSGAPREVNRLVERFCCLYG